MKVFLAPDSRLHSPSHSLAQYVSAFTAGADGGFLSLQKTLDGHIVVYGESDISASTSASGKIADIGFAALRQLNFGAKFTNHLGEPVRHYAEISSLRAMLRLLPEEFECVVGFAQAAVTDTCTDFLRQAACELKEERDVSRVLWFAHTLAEAGILHEYCTDIPLAVRMQTLKPDFDFPRLQRIDAIVALCDEVIDDTGLTDAGLRLAALHEEGLLPRGAILISDVPSPAQVRIAQQHAFIHAICSNSMVAMTDTLRRGRVFIDETFQGRDVNTEKWAFGYARAGNDCHVYQDDGLHVDIYPYQEPQPPGTADGIERRVRRLEGLMQLALRRTPTYCGGGAGLVQAIQGAFVAEVDVASQRAVQSTMVEIAVLNVNPGRHLPPWNPDGSPRMPGNDHDKHAFFDPHGAPPFVGSEHDEDDGFRINSHFGSEYADNNYGRDAGEGKLLNVTLRLERRGAYFSTYVRPQSEADPDGWICTGVVRNDSLNGRVYLRCVGKRWQKADPQNAGGYLPVVPNHFLFSRVMVKRFAT